MPILYEHGWEYTEAEIEAMADEQEEQQRLERFEELEDEMFETMSTEEIEFYKEQQKQLIKAKMDRFINPVLINDLPF